MHESGLLPLRRAACYLGALALKQNSPHVALEIVSALSSQNFVLVRSIKVSIYCYSPYHLHFSRTNLF